MLRRRALFAVAAAALLHGCGNDDTPAPASGGPIGLPIPSGQRALFWPALGASAPSVQEWYSDLPWHQTYIPQVAERICA